MVDPNIGISAANPSGQSLVGKQAELLEKQIVAAEKSRKIVFVRKHKEFE